MLFMVIEHFRDVSAIGDRFARSGRMLPDGVVYHASWVEPDGSRCFQLMQAPDRAALEAWTRRWQDLCDFEVVPVLTSQEFWAEIEAKGRDEKNRPGKPDRSSS